jgi:hypothetical protein
MTPSACTAHPRPGPCSDTMAHGPSLHRRGLRPWLRPWWPGLRNRSWTDLRRAPARRSARDDGGRPCPLTSAACVPGAQSPEKRRIARFPVMEACQSEPPMILGDDTPCGRVARASGVLQVVNWVRMSSLNGRRCLGWAQLVRSVNSSPAATAFGPPIPLRPPRPRQTHTPRTASRSSPPETRAAPRTGASIRRAGP